MDLYISLITEDRKQAIELLVNGCIEIGLDLTEAVETLQESNYCKSLDNTTDIDWVGKVPMPQEDPESPIQFFEGIHVNIRTTKEIDLGVEDAASYVSTYSGFKLHTPPLPYRIFA